MWRVAIIITILLIVLLFVAPNMHSTELHVPFTKGFEIRTAFLLIVSFLLGYAAAYFVGLAKNVKNRKKGSAKE